MNKKKVSLILNVLIVILEIIGFIVTYKINSKISYVYYTEDSNILALFTCLIFVCFLLTNKKIPKWLSIMKYISTICLSITFLVVLFILTPMYGFDFKFMFFSDALIFQHLLCPILSIITFVMFDDLGSFDKKDSFLGIGLTLLYTFILVILNLLDVVYGPYPFLKVKNQTILMSFIWFIVIIGFSYFISIALRKIYLKVRK